jgi:hypothetical protein
MEPEDDNAITIPFTGDTFVSDYITFTNTLNVDGSFLTYTGGAGWETEVSNYRDNVDNKIVIPYAFEKVLKKSIEGLEDVRMVQYKSWGSDNTTFNLHLELKISWDVKQLYTKKDYTEKINHLFKMTYPNNGLYKFEVKHVIGGENDKHKEFFEFFSR